MPLWRKCRYSHDLAAFAAVNNQQSSKPAEEGPAPTDGGWGEWGAPAGVQKSFSSAVVLEDHDGRYGDRSLNDGTDAESVDSYPVQVQLCDDECERIPIHLKVDAACPGAAEARVVAPKNLHSLAELPASWWETRENDLQGYQMEVGTVCQTGGRDMYTQTLLDTCAATNSITEEHVVDAMKESWAAGIKTDDPRFPVVA